MSFEKLLTPGMIGGLELKNRIIRSGAGTESARDCRLTDANYELYRAWAHGGAGLVITEGIYVTYGMGAYPPLSPRFDSDDYLVGMQKLVDIVHEEGSKIFMQIMHLGSWDLDPNNIPIASSTLTADENPPMEQPFPPTAPPRGIGLEEIPHIVEGFVDIAKRAKRAGFDGVELNAAGAHFLNSFLSRVWNKRDDEYGAQSIENRTRLVCQIIRAVKDACGSDFPVTVLMNGQESGIGGRGTTLAEAVEFAKCFETAGADGLQVRNYGYGEDTARQWVENTVYPEPVSDMPASLDWSRDGAGAYLPLARAIRESVSIPVITVGRQGPEVGEAALEAGDADFIAMQRRLIADPDLPNKLAAGRPEDIRPCTACLYCSSSPGTGRLTCRVNPRVGLSHSFEPAPLVTKKDVAVVGGGPGGMEAARILATRGHKVTLFEAGKSLGGLLPMASIVKGTRTENLLELVAYYETQLKKYGVNVCTKTHFEAPMADGFDAVVIAAGGKDAPFVIPGTDKKIFVSNEALHSMLSKMLGVLDANKLRSLTKLFMPLGKEVVIIGGAIQGAELAEYLLLRDRKVTLVSQGSVDDIGAGMASIKRVYLMDWFARKDIRIVTDVREYKEITDKGLLIVNADGQEELLAAKSVCTALPLEPNTALYDAVASRQSCEVYAVGDCRIGDGLILDAIAQGYEVGNSL